MNKIAPELQNINEAFLASEKEFLLNVKRNSPWKTWRQFILGTAEFYEERK